jgi:hypothetical protein
MHRLWDFLWHNPILLFVLGAWLIGMIGNVIKARTNARERAEKLTRPQPVPPPRGATQQQQAPVRQTPPARTARAPQSAEDIAREMRRILGLDPDAAQATAPQQAPVQQQATVPQQPRRSGGQARPQPPAPPAGRERRLERHVDPHVGEGIRDRHMQSRVGQPRSGRSSMGSLGGRTKQVTRRAAAVTRFALDDLRTAFVMSEILAPPVALRPFESRRPD